LILVGKIAPSRVHFKAETPTPALKLLRLHSIHKTKETPIHTKVLLVETTTKATTIKETEAAVDLVEVVVEVEDVGKVSFYNSTDQMSNDLSQIVQRSIN